MITVTKQENGVLFTFENSDKYLYGSGTIEVPFNSLSIIQDESDMITLRKSASNDIFLAARYDTDLGYSSKEEAVEALKGMLYDEAGISEEEVQDMIDAATSGIPSSQVVEQLRTDVNAVSGDVQTNAANIQDIYDTIDEKEEVIASALTQLRQDVSDIDAKEEVIASALTEVRQNVDTLSGDVQTKVATSDFNAYSAATATAIGNKQDALVFYSEAEYDEEMGEEATAQIYVLGQGDSSGNGGEVNVQPYSVALSASSEGEDPMSTTLVVTSDGVTINDERVLTESDGTYFIDLDAIMSSGGLTDADWDGAIAAVNAHRPVYIKFYNGHYILESYYLYDNIMYLSASDGRAASRFTIIKNGSNDYSLNRVIRGFVSDAETERWNGKQDALSAGTGIEISGNVISATGGGGATYSAGTNISIDTANTINCTLNLRNGTQTNSLTGVQGEANAQDSFAFGNGSTAGTNRIDNYAFSFGGNCKARKGRTFAFGFNVDTKEIDSAAFGSNITLNAPRSFSTGFHNTTNNWTNIALGEELTTNNRPEFATGAYNNSVTGSTASGQTLFSVGNGTSSARHNAFEIRQNGDIYVNDGTNDVRLQDTILALGGLKLVKLTQAEYDALVSGGTVDANTLYIINNVV